MKTEKMLRKMLEQEFNVDLKPQKAIIRSEIENYLEQLEEQPAIMTDDQRDEDANEGDGNDESGTGKRKRGSRSSAAFGDVLSEAMAAFLGMDRCPRTQVVKKLWEYIKANDLQDPKDRRRIILDDKLKTIFPGKSVNMLSMQKHLSKHVFVAADLGLTGDEDSNEDIKTVTPKRAARSSATSRDEKKVNGFTKPLKLAPDLAAWVGKDTASRPEITKHLWNYVKEKNLQDPGNKQYVIADEVLQQLTGQRRFLAFSFQKLLTTQILGYVE
jgi:upstream activation factor subunit UAF30